MKALLLRICTVEVPAESRPAFRREVTATLVRVVSHQVLLQLAAQLILRIGGNESLTALLFAAPFIGLLLSLAYVEWGQRASPLTLVFWPDVVARLCLIAALPVGLFASAEAEPLLLTLLLSVSFAASHLSTPLLGAIYGAIYPSTMRGRIVAFGRMLQGVVAIGALLALGGLFDVDPRLYAYVLPVIGVIGLVTSWWFCSLPRTGYLAPPQTLAQQQQEQARAGKSQRSPVAHPGRRFAFWYVLRSDGNYVRYQAFQMLHGLANLMAVPVLAVYVYERLQLSIVEAMWVVNSGIIMNMLVLLTVRFHGRIFDWIGVLRHRVFTSVMLALGWLVFALFESFAGACVAAALMGFGRAGGQIVWLIGSLSFAPRHLQGIYSGIHTFLTGVRGAAAPLIGIALVATPGSPFEGRYDTFFLFVFVLIMLSALGHAFLVKVPRIHEDGDGDDGGGEKASATAEGLDALGTANAATPLRNLDS